MKKCIKCLSQYLTFAILVDILIKISESVKCEIPSIVFNALLIIGAIPIVIDMYDTMR